MLISIRNNRILCLTYEVLYNQLFLYLSRLLLSLYCYETTTFNCSDVGGLKATEEMKIIGSTDHRLALRNYLLI